MRTSLIVAADDSDVIGSDGALPWHLPEDLKRFRRLTEGHVVLAGRRTNDSIVRRLGQSLPGRITVVVSRQVDLPPAPRIVYKPDLVAGLAAAQAIEEFAGRDEVFVIGGGQVYADVLPYVQRIYLTRVRGTFPGDCSLPPGWLAPFTLREEIPHDGFSYLTYERG